MVWTKKSSSTWTDDYDGAEKVFYGMSQAFKPYNREHGSVYAICCIRSTGLELNDLCERLKQAWTRLRFEFPALTVFEEDGRKTYLEPNAANIQTWVHHTFWVDEKADTARSIVADLHLRKLPCLVFVPQSSEVLFHCSHWRIDALGTCLVLDRLFSTLSELSDARPGRSEPLHWELEHEHLSPSLEDAYGSAKMSTPSTEAKAEEVRQRNFDKAYPSAGLAYQGDQSTDPGVSRCQTVAFGKESSDQLVRACRARGFTVTAAVHAACAASVFNSCAADDAGCASYSTVVSANLRPLLPGAASTYTCGTYVTGITHTLRRADDFGSWCRQLTSGYRGDWDAAAYMDALRSIYRVHGQTMAKVAASSTRRPASNVTISSLGLIDNKYLHADHGSIQVESFHLGSAIMGRQPTLYIWTFRSCLTLSVDYNEAYYSASQISALLESIRYHLNEELGSYLRVVDL